MTADHSRWHTSYSCTGRRILGHHRVGSHNRFLPVIHASLVIVTLHPIHTSSAMTTEVLLLPHRYAFFVKLWS